MYVHVAFGLAQGMLMPMNLKVDALSWPGFFYTLLSVWITDAHEQIQQQLLSQLKKHESFPLAHMPSSMSS